MCGRLSVTDDPLMKMVSLALGLGFVTVTNHDLRPTQTVAAVALVDGQLQQVNLKWGIKPAWSKKLLINAQAETVAEKKTFKKAFSERRCVIPCSGWYEWRNEGGARKQKYLFEPADGLGFFMAGIWYPGDDNQLVTLTIEPNELCARYHHRMPLLIDADAIAKYLSADVDQVQALIHAPDSDLIRVSRQ